MALMSRTRFYNWYISMVVSACMVLYGYDASVYNSVQGSQRWIKWFDNPSPNLIGAVNTAYTVGCIIGGFFLGGPIADYFGRKVGMSIGCMCVVVATFMQAFAPYHKIGLFIAGRAIIGAGQAIAATSGPIYIGELAPPHIRGRIMTLWQTFYSVGSFICFWVNYGCTHHADKLGEWDWKMVVMFQLLVPLTLLVLLPFIPGSPRWFIRHGNNTEKARAALRRVRDTEEEVEEELLQILSAIEYEKEAISSSYSALWKDKSVRKRLFSACLLNAGQQITGEGTLNAYSTKIYQKVFKSADQISLINALNATFGIIFTLNAIWIIDRFGRKPLLITGSLCMAFCMIIVAAVYTETPSTPDGRKSESIGIAIVFLLFLFNMFFKPSWGAGVWTWTAEVFSMNVRAQGVGMASQTQSVVNAIFQQFFPIFLKNEGFYAFYLFSGINVLLAAYVWFFLPETKNVSLEEMDTLFGGANHVAMGEAVIANHVADGKLDTDIGQLNDNKVDASQVQNIEDVTKRV